MYPEAFFFKQKMTYINIAILQINMGDHISHIYRNNIGEQT